MFSKSKFFVLALAVASTVVLVGTPTIEDAEAGRRYRHNRVRPRAQLVLVPRGLYFGAGIVGTKILKQNGGPELLDDGAGLTLYGGIRVSRALALELGWVGTAHNPETVDVGFGPETDFLVLNGFTADAKVFLGANGMRSTVARPGEAQPYIQGGLGVYFLDSSAFGTQSVGTGFQLGGGLDWVVGRNVDLGVRGLYRGMAMGPPDSNQDDTFVSAVSVEGSLTLRF